MITFTRPLKNIFNLTLKTGTLNMQKSVYQNGERYFIDNYRSIVILCNFSSV